MPRPLYIACAVSGAVDQYTNAVSLYGLIESINFRELKPPPDAAPGTPLVVKPLSMRIVAAWLKEDGDAPEQIFEAELVGFLPGNETEAIHAPFPPFKFVTPIHRLIVPEATVPHHLDMRSGLLRFVCRVRRAGETEWARSQEYVILVEEKPEEAPQAASPPAT